MSIARKNKKRLIVLKLKDNISLKELENFGFKYVEDKRIVDVKGAIWSDFGLRYVARLTEDGGIELICT